MTATWDTLLGRGEQDRKILGIPSRFLLCPEVAISREKAKALPISLAKDPTLHRIAVGSNFESGWRYERGAAL